MELHLLDRGPAEQSGGPEYEDEHKQREGQHIFIVAGEVTGGEALRQPKHKTAQHGPRNGAYASENRRGEGFHPGQKPDGEAHLPGAGGNKRAAQRGKGAWLNGQRLHVTQHAVHDSLLLFGSAINYRETIPETLRFVEALLPNCLDFRRGGSAALDCCYVAAGRADLFFECKLCPWDYAAGGLIVTEAGGIATQLDGSPLALTQRGSVAMGNAVNHPELLAIARRIREGGDA